jgi:hypothetical protein
VTGCQPLRSNQKGIDAMNDITIELEQAEEEILTYEVSDNALESAACTITWKAGSMTLAFCSGLDSCPS